MYIEFGPFENKIYGSNLCLPFLSLFRLCTAIFETFGIETRCNCLRKAIKLTVVGGNKYFVQVSLELAAQALSNLHLPVLQALNSLNNLEIP